MKKLVKTKECVIKKFFKTKKNLPIIGIGGLILAFAIYALVAPSAFKWIADNMFGSAMHLKSYTTNGFIYAAAEVDCMDNINIDLEKSCSDNMAEIDWMEEAVDVCEIHDGVENLSFNIHDRCETEQEFNCTDNEVLAAAENYEWNYYEFMDWIEEYADECNLENNQYDWILFECDNGDEMNFDISPSNWDCDEYLEWMDAATIYCSTWGRENISDFQLYGLNCNNNQAGDCTNEELLECITADDFDACVAECSWIEWDLEINYAKFIANDNNQAEIEIEIENNSDIDMHISDIIHTVKLSTENISNSQYDMDWNGNPLVTVDAWDEVIITADLELDGTLVFQPESKIKFSVTSIEDDEDTNNNTMTAYITGDFLWGFKEIEPKKDIKSSKKTLNDLKSLLER